MQSIFTKYVGPSNVRGSRIIATASGNAGKTTVSYNDDLPRDEAHAEAVKALCAKLGWRGAMIGSDTKDGMVWVFDNPMNTRIEIA